MKTKSTRALTRVCPEVHFQARLPFEFFLANLTLVHCSFIPVRKRKHENEYLTNSHRKTLFFFLSKINEEMKS